MLGKEVVPFALARLRGSKDAMKPIVDGLPRVARAFVDNLPFTCGLTIQYAPGALTGAATHQSLATGWPIGKRFHSAPVVRLADATQLDLQNALLVRNAIVCVGDVLLSR